jgi:hypothetical protein
MATKTIVNPRMNMSELKMMILFTSEGLFSAVSCSKDIPLIKETYEGIRGSTQGETNESNPAINAK